MLVFRRYPDKAKLILWTATGVSVGSMFISSWATHTWQLILLQGVLGGTSGAVLYTPVLLWLQDYWVERRGMASGIIFAGTGIGGFVFPFLIGSLLDRVVRYFLRSALATSLTWGRDSLGRSVSGPASLSSRSAPPSPLFVLASPPPVPRGEKLAALSSPSTPPSSPTPSSSSWSVPSSPLSQVLTLFTVNHDLPLLALLLPCILHHSARHHRQAELRVDV